MFRPCNATKVSETRLKEGRNRACDEERFHLCVITGEGM